MSGPQPLVSCFCGCVPISKAQSTVHHVRVRFIAAWSCIWSFPLALSCCSLATVPCPSIREKPHIGSRKITTFSIWLDDSCSQSHHVWPEPSCMPLQALSRSMHSLHRGGRHLREREAALQDSWASCCRASATLQALLAPPIPAGLPGIL